MLMLMLTLLYMSRDWSVLYCTKGFIDCHEGVLYLYHILTAEPNRCDVRTKIYDLSHGQRELKTVTRLSKKDGRLSPLNFFVL